jgi:hypothetical protein
VAAVSGDLPHLGPEDSARIARELTPEQRKRLERLETDMRRDEHLVGDRMPDRAPTAAELDTPAVRRWIEQYDDRARLEAIETTKPTPWDGGGLRFLEVSAELIEVILQYGQTGTQIRPPVPRDLKIVGAGYHEERRRFWLLIASPDFSIIPRGALTPSWSPIFDVADPPARPLEPRPRRVQRPLNRVRHAWRMLRTGLFERE